MKWAGGGLAQVVGDGKQEGGSRIFHTDGGWVPSFRSKGSRTPAAPVVCVENVRARNKQQSQSGIRGHRGVSV